VVSANPSRQSQSKDGLAAVRKSMWCAPNRRATPKPFRSSRHGLGSESAWARPTAARRFCPWAR
jgi:hypothetical protein